ncbi:MAG: ATP synthase F1 subunit gamma [Lachnospiraceae bacterium]|nr:ATP synthase F1 subunit gamma [Lachnospiraceae bacterium]
MANAREIKSRMKSIQDTMKITNAMYMISSTKLRKARTSLEETEPYFFTLQAMIDRILRHLPDIENEFFNLRKFKAPEDRVQGIIVVTADKGLAGAYNHNVLKLAQQELENNNAYKLYVVGEVGRQYFKAKEIPVDEHFLYTAQNPSLHRARIISETVMEDFKNGKIDDVIIIYTSMKNNVVAETERKLLLPLKREDFALHHADALKAGIYQEEILFNPSPDAVLENVIPDTVMGYIYGALVESYCSEQNARMMAMDAANKSASEMIHDLSIEYNRVRQAMITQEITEVISGAKAQKKKKN